MAAGATDPGDRKCGPGQSDGRRRGDVSDQEHRPERRQFEGPHDAGRGGQGRRAWSTRLSGKGPFTVFAPTNAAFAKLPAGTVETLVKPENKATLDKILTYHVVPGRITAQQIAAMAAQAWRHRDAEDGRGREPARS